MRNLENAIPPLEIKKPGKILWIYNKLTNQVIIFKLVDGSSLITKTTVYILTNDDNLILKCYFWCMVIMYRTQRVENTSIYKVCISRRLFLKTI